MTGSSLGASICHILFSGPSTTTQIITDDPGEQLCEWTICGMTEHTHAHAHTHTDTHMHTHTYTHIYTKLHGYGYIYT